jgi:16S rRNA G1207 methylase RsmC
MAGLSNADKIELIDNHVRSLAYSEYNLQLNLIEENAAPTVNALTVDNINAELAVIAAKKAALEAEKESLAE